MTLNRAYRPAQIIAFPLGKAKERKPLGEMEERGKVLLYTGVRYERQECVETAWHDDNHRPRRGGSRS